MKPTLSRLYQYVGPLEIMQRAATSPAPPPIGSLCDLLEQLRSFGFQRRSGYSLTVTFVIDADGRLRIADRHSEHVVCAGCGEVQSAGEMTFEWNSDRCVVESISNQSTGYCPEPLSWNAVDVALTGIGVCHTGRFDPEFEFRRCSRCKQINIVKDNWFFCSICGTPLPAHWNCNDSFPNLKHKEPLDGHVAR